MDNGATFLTEMILTIHHEVQSALDYIDSVAREEPTELGESLAFIMVDKVHVRLPIIYDIEQETHSIREKERTKEGPEFIKRNLAARRGFTVDIGKPGGRATFSKVRVISPKPEEVKETEEEVPRNLTGEIDIQFSVLSRR